MTFIISAWIASISFGLVSIIGKLTNKYEIKNPWLFNFLWMLFSLLLTVPIAFVNQVGIPTHWGSLTLVAFFNAAFGILYIMSLSKLDVSVIIPLLNLRTAFVAIIGALFLGETLSFFQYILVFIILVGGIFVSIDEKFSIRSFLNKPIFIAILCTISYTLMGVFIKTSIAQNGYWEVTLWMAILSQIMLLVTVPLFAKEIAKVDIKQAGSVFAMSLSLAIGVIFENRAYKDNVVLTSIITALPISMFIAFLFSFFAPQLLEKHTIKVYAIRFSAATIMILAALKLSNVI